MMFNLRGLVFAGLGLLATLLVLPCGNASTLWAEFAPLPPGAVIDLTAEGATDWAHWGLDATNFFDHKISATQQISDFTLLGVNPPEQETASLIGYTWTDGTPTPGVTNTTTSVSVTGLMSGFSISVPADTFLRELKVYLGAYAARGQFQAVLSDSAGPGYTDFALDDEFESTNGVYTIHYAAGSTGQVLTVTFTVNAMHDADFGNISLQAAALVFIGTNRPPSVALTSPAADSNFALSDPIMITAEASDSDGSIRSVKFYDGALKLDEETNSPYTFLWTNAPLGWHRLTAVARDNFGAIQPRAPVCPSWSSSPPPAEWSQRAWPSRPAR